MNTEKQKPNLIIGIDPGLSGAVAIYNPLENSLIDVFDMPLHEVKGRRHLDLYQLAMAIDGYASQTKLAIIEDVSAMPGQGVTSMFRFGVATGVPAGILAALMVPIFFAHPASWKNAMGLSRDKDASRQMASRMFPKETKRFARKKDDGRAEALLLAVFASRHS